MLDWVRDGGDWPNREHSRFVDAGDTFWHVQVFGEIGDGRPVALLVHGTAGASHSFRDLAPLLAAYFTVIVPDLPGHGFTSIPRRAALSLAGMSEGLAKLLEALGAAPDAVAGHSAGAAILAHMSIEGRIAPRCLVAYAGAFLPFGGVAGQVFPALARVLAINPFIPHGVSRLAEGVSVDRLMEGIGSSLDERGTALYRRVLSSQAHISAALGMMASWELRGLERALPHLRVPLTMVAGALDRAVPPAQAERVARMVPGARLVVLPGRGHLAHEEDPETAARLFRDAFGDVDRDAP
jgi:magnesium chelatase accessory protein